MSREDIVTYYHKHYIPQNMTLSLVGNIAGYLPVIKDILQPETTTSSIRT